MSVILMDSWGIYCFTKCYENLFVTSSTFRHIFKSTCKMHVNTFLLHRLHLTSCVCEITQENICQTTAVSHPHLKHTCFFANAQAHALAHKRTAIVQPCKQHAKQAPPPAATRWGLGVQQGANTPFICQAENKQQWRCELLPKHWLWFYSLRVVLMSGC